MYRSPRTAAVSLIAVSLIGLVVLAAVVFGLWQAGWWFRNQDAQRNGQVSQNSYGYQESHKDQLANQISSIKAIDVQLAATKDPNQLAMLEAQRRAELNDACRTSDQITNLPADQAAWRVQNCGG